MRTELDNELCTKYPNLYGDRYAEPSDTLMCWGFMCGDGWFELIDDLSSKLETLIIALPTWKRMNYRALEVKQKFGTLRFYMTSTTAEMNAAISAAEIRSATTCEQCGKPGETLKDSYWIKTLCGEHARKGIRVDAS